MTTLITINQNSCCIDVTVEVSSYDAYVVWCMVYDGILYATLQIDQSGVKLTELELSDECQGIYSVLLTLFYSVLIYFSGVP